MRYTIKGKGWEVRLLSAKGVCTGYMNAYFEDHAASPRFEEWLINSYDLAKVRRELPAMARELIRAKRTKAGWWCGMEMREAHRFLERLKPYMRD